MLDARGVRYEVFALPPSKLGAIQAAAAMQVDPGLVFKTIVVLAEPPNKPVLVLVPGGALVDLKKVAIALGEKKARLPTEREAEALTGLQSGGISPLALLNKGFRTLMDVAAREHAEIHVSGGERGINIKLPVEDLARLTGARFADVSRPVQRNEPGIISP
jgi:Cys-tRNA(Pro)/Cys-tRNA(Cys) deacylase